MNEDGVVGSIDGVDLRPEQEFTFGKGRNIDAGMVNAYILFLAQFLLTVKEVEAGQEKKEMGSAYKPLPMQKHFGGYDKEE